MRLVKELNNICEAAGLQKVRDPERFLDWLTFSSTTPAGSDGEPVVEPGYGFVVRVFHDADNFKNFKIEIEGLLKARRMMSMLDVHRVVHFKQEMSKCVE